jgi:hypothetical protein
MIDYNKVPRGQEVDENGRVVAGGTTVELRIATATQSNAQAISFSELPKAILVSTREATNKVAIWIGTNTMSDGGSYYTLHPNVQMSIDLASTGPFYVRALSAGVTTVVEGLALL